MLIAIFQLSIYYVRLVQVCNCIKTGHQKALPWNEKSEANTVIQFLLKIMCLCASYSGIHLFCHKPGMAAILLGLLWK